MAAQALVRRGRDSDDPKIPSGSSSCRSTGPGSDPEMWAESPARSLPGALWRLYALRAATIQDPERISVYFKAGKDTAQVSHVVAASPNRPARMR